MARKKPSSTFGSLSIAVTSQKQNVKISQFRSEKKRKCIANHLNHDVRYICGKYFHCRASFSKYKIRQHWILLFSSEVVYTCVEQDTKCPSVLPTCGVLRKGLLHTGALWVWQRAASVGFHGHQPEGVSLSDERALGRLSTILHYQS